MTLRGVDWAVVLGGSAIGAAILAGCVVFAEDGPPLPQVRLALISLVAAAAFVLDEPAAATVDAMPNTRRRRTAARTTAVALPLAVWVLGVLALELRTAVTPAGGLLVEGAGVLAVAVAAAAVLRLVGRADPGEAVATVLGAGMLGVIIFNPPPRSVPIFPIDHGWAASTTLWVGLTAAAVILVLFASRDPYRPGRM